MLFQAIGPDKQSKMGTDHVECIPWDNIFSMSQAGYTFKYQGKIISKTALLSLNAKSTSTVSSVDCKANSKPRIKCIDTGTIYNSQSEAAKDLKIDPAQVSDSIKTGRPRSGYTFIKVLE